MRARGAADRSVPAVVCAHVQSPLEKILKVRKKWCVARFWTCAAAAELATEEVAHEPHQNEPCVSAPRNVRIGMRRRRRSSRRRRRGGAGARAAAGRGGGGRRNTMLGELRLTRST